MGAEGEEIVVKCEHCGKKLKTQDKHIGRKGRCPSCGSIIELTRQSDGTAKGKVEKVVQTDEVQGSEAALLKISKQNDVAVVAFRTSRILDQSNVQQLGEEFDDLIKKHHFKKIVINFDKIHYMSSAVMGKLVALHKQTKAAGGELRLCNIAPSIHEIFEIMRFDKLFSICKTEDDAVIELMR